MSLKPFVCVNCDKSFSTIKTYHFHLKNVSHEKPSPENLICKFCQQSDFKTIGGRKRHEQKCPVNKDNTLNVKRIICRQCGYSFASVKTLQFHLKKFHDFKGTKSDVPEKMCYRTEDFFKCQYCDFTTTRPNAIALHLNLRLADNGKCPSGPHLPPITCVEEWEMNEKDPILLNPSEYSKPLQ